MATSSASNAERHESRWLKRVTESESKSAAILVVAAITALLLATLSPDFADFVHHTQLPILQLSFAEFAADGLLVVFFFVAEFVA